MSDGSAKRIEFNNKYTQALEETDYEYQTLRVYKYVAGNVEMLIRINNLSFNHHREVAPLEPKDQKIVQRVAESFINSLFSKIICALEDWLAFFSLQNFLPLPLLPYYLF